MKANASEIGLSNNESKGNNTSKPIEKADGTTSQSRIARLKDLLGKIKVKTAKKDANVGPETNHTEPERSEADVVTEKLGQSLIEANRGKSEVQQPEQQQPEENEEIAKGKQVLAETIDVVRDWDEFKDSGSVPKEFAAEFEGLNLQQLYSRERQLEQEIIGLTNVIGSPYGLAQQEQRIGSSLGERVVFAQKNLVAKKQIIELFAKMEAIKDKTKIEALKYAGVDSEDELIDLEKQFPTSSDDFRFKPMDADIVWDAVRDAIKTNDPRYQDREVVIEGFESIWSANSEIIDYQKREEILQMIYEGAKASGNEDLARRMRAQIIFTASISLYSANSSERELMPQREWFETKSREELLAGAYYLSDFMDHTEGGVGNMKNAAFGLGIDAEALRAAYDDRSADFYGKAVTADSKIPLDQYPDYFKRLLARSFDGRRLRDFAQDFPIEKIATSEYFRRLGDIFESDTVFSEIAGEKIKTFKMLDNSPVITGKIKEGHYNYETLIRRIVRQGDWKKVGAKFEKIASEGNESEFVWEYFRLVAKEKGSGMVLNIPASNKDIPGLPDKLQWRNLSRADRQRLVMGDVDSELFEPENLTDVGRLVMTKAIIEEVLTRSQDVKAKETADRRNRELVNKGSVVLEEGDLLHGTDVANIGAILYGGERAGEFLGFDETRDMTPFMADFSAVLATETSGEFDYDDSAALKYLDIAALRKIFKNNPFRGIYSASIASQYGAREEGGFTSRDAKSDLNTGVSLIFKRGREDAFLKGTENTGHMREHHTLVYVGMPATEISGMVVNRESVETIEKVKAEIVKNGFYIPIYDLDGQLIFTSEEYDSAGTTEKAA